MSERHRYMTYLTRWQSSTVQCSMAQVRQSNGVSNDILAWCSMILTFHRMQCMLYIGLSWTNFKLVGRLWSLSATDSPVLASPAGTQFSGVAATCPEFTYSWYAIATVAKEKPRTTANSKIGGSNHFGLNNYSVLNPIYVPWLQ